MENAILDVLTEGIISVDASGRIKTFNRKARHIFGIEGLACVEHNSGKLEKGDLIILVSTELGEDDGHMDGGLLRKIGLTEKISPGASIAAIGLYDETGIAHIKVLDQASAGTKIEMTHVYRKKRISARLDLKARYIDILIDGRSFTVHYVKTFGHMVVLSGDTLDVKFVQTHGYSYRKESIGELLRGGGYDEKTKQHSVNLLGRPLEEVLNEPSLVKALRKAASGASKGFEGRYMDIHERPVLCSLRVAEKGNGKREALLIVEDISELNIVIEERNQAISELESIRSQMLRKREPDPMPELIGTSISMMRVKQLGASAAKSLSNVLILGESGTGKNVLASAIHNRSKVAEGPFVHVNCGALPEHLIESELFGYSGGAFTGAKDKGKPGFFELADSGTLFLDEIGELPVQVQVKLLHAIQSGSFYRVGGTKEVRVNVRIIAATNRDLQKDVVSGRFREDLYYRLNVLRIKIPPLRERREDVRELAERIMPTISSKIHTASFLITEDAYYALQSYTFPGNVRELENILERAVNLSEGGKIGKEHLQMEAFSKSDYQSNDYEIIRPLKEVIQEAERKEIIKAIARTEGDRELAIKKLGIGKSSFYEKIKKYDIKH